MDKKQCVVCGEHVDYIKHFGAVKRSAAGNSYRSRPVFVNTKNERWWGKKCPDCRDSKAPVIVRPAKQNRKCLRCGKPLQVNRYYHPGCLALMTDKYDGSDYGYSYVG